MKNIRRSLIIIFIIALTIFSGGSFTLATQSTTAKKLGLYESGNRRTTGYYTTGTYNSVKPSIPVIKIVEYNSSGSAVDESKSKQPIYCLKDGRGFASDASTGSSSVIDYNQYFDMRYPESMGEYRQYLPTNTEDYNKLMWLLDNICIPEDEASVNYLLNVAGDYKKSDFTEKSVSEEQIKDILEVIQQSAIWFITNKGDNFQPSENTTFAISQFNGYGEVNLEEKLEMDPLDNPIKGLYEYLITQPQSNGSYDYKAVDSSPLTLEHDRVTISYQGDSVIIGPYKIEAIDNYSNFQANVYKGSENIGNATILGASKENISGSTTTEKIKSTIGNDFYIQVPIGNEEVKIEISADKKIKKLTYWSTPISSAEVNQPVVIIDTESKSYKVSDTQTPKDNRTTKVKITKVWNDENDQDGIRPESIQVDLLKNGSLLETITLNAANSWTYSRADLPMYEDGVLQSYTFQEKNVPAGYTSSIQKNDVTDYIISNSHTPDVTQLTVKKQWSDADDQDGIRPEFIEVELLKNDTVYREHRLDESNGWSYTFTELPVNEGGNKITYSVREKNTPNGYTPSIPSEFDDEVTITNSHTPAETEITVKKVWSDYGDQDGLRTESIQVELLKNGTKYKDCELNEDNSWTFKFTNLPVNEGGSKITYSVREKDTPDGYEAAVTGNETIGFTITNTHTPDYTKLTVKKVWSDANNQDGIRPSYIMVELLANGTKEQEIRLDESNSWTHTFDNLPSKKDGTKITYTVQEVNLPQGYTSAVSGSAEQGFTITNSYNPQVTQVSVNKEWVDNNNKFSKRPSSVTVQLFADGNFNQEIELNDENHWSHTFTDLPLKQNGNNIVYTVKEKESADLSLYESSITGNAQQGFKITNTYKIFDLALRKYITKVNGKNLQELNIPERTPKISTDSLVSGTTATYNHKKDPVLVKNGDVITYSITIYNEGEKSGYASQIIDQLPTGLKFQKVNTITSKDSKGNNKNTYNVQYDEQNNKITLNIQNSAKDLKAYGTELDFETLEINCIVDYNAKFGKKNILTNTAWISSDFDTEDNKAGEDIDSQPSNNPQVNKDNMEDYKGKTTNPEELSDSNHYYEGEQDDDDFEKVYVKIFDLALRKFIVSVNDKKLSTNGVYDRAPTVDVTPLKNGENTAKYNHTKDPVRVKVNDTVIYAIRVYNEGEVDGYADEITDYLPPELEFLPNDETNKKYGWTLDENDKDGRTIKTDYLSKQKNAEGNLLKGFSGEGTLDYKELLVKCKVKDTAKTLKKITNIAEITKSSNEYNIPDRDNEEKVNRPEDSKLPDYKGKDTNKDELNDKNYHYEGQEDDDDFEKILVERFDLALRKFITGVNNEKVTSRVPMVNPSKYGTVVDGKEITDMEYTHPKDPVRVANNDIVIYTIRVYNEGTQSGYAAEIKDDIPEGLEFILDHEINKKYGWVLYDKDGNVTTNVKEAVTMRTDYLSKDNEEVEGEYLLKAFIPGEMETPDYKDVQIAFKVTEPNTSDRIITNHAEISKDTDEDGEDVDDIDSIPDEWNEGEDDQDVEHLYVKYFDLALRKWVSQVILIEDGVQKEMDTGHYAEQDPEPVVKVELNKKRIENTIVKFRYQIRITNEGEIEGYATEISDYIPEGLKFNQADNPKWKEVNGKIVTDQLKDTLLQPGETATVDVVLTWINGEDNLDVKTNVAEISEDDNPHGADDIDSTPNNKKEGEDDIDDAPVVLTVVTGRTPIYIAIITGITFIIGAGAFMIKKYVV